MSQTQTNSRAATPMPIAPTKCQILWDGMACNASLQRTEPPWFLLEEERTLSALVQSSLPPPPPPVKLTSTDSQRPHCATFHCVFHFSH